MKLYLIRQKSFCAELKLCKFRVVYYVTRQKNWTAIYGINGPVDTMENQTDAYKLNAFGSPEQAFCWKPVWTATDCSVDCERFYFDNTPYESGVKLTVDQLCLEVCPKGCGPFRNLPRGEDAFVTEYQKFGSGFQQAIDIALTPAFSIAIIVILISMYLLDMTQSRARFDLAQKLTEEIATASQEKEVHLDSLLVSELKQHELLVALDKYTGPGSEKIRDLVKDLRNTSSTSNMDEDLASRRYTLSYLRPSISPPTTTQMETDL